MSAPDKSEQIDAVNGAYDIATDSGREPYRIDSPVIENGVLVFALEFGDFPGRFRVEPAEETLRTYHAGGLTADDTVVLYADPERDDWSELAEYFRERGSELTTETYYGIGPVAIRFGERHVESVPAIYASGNPVPENIDIYMPTGQGQQDSLENIVQEVL